MPKMQETELKSILANEINLALGADGGKLSQERRQLLEYYEGRPLGNEQDGRSQVVSRNVLEVVEWVLPSLLRVFAASDKIVEFEPYRPGEEAAAQQATAYVNYILTRDNPGFMVLHDWFKDSLIQKVGYLKVYWQEQKTSSTNTFTGLNDLEYQQLTQSGDVEIIEEHTYPNPDPRMVWFTGDDPTPQAPTLHDIRLRVWQTEGRVKIENCAPEEILVSRRAPSTVLDGKHFVAHRALKRASDLREMGFDEDLIEQASSFDENEFNSERVARFQVDDDWPMGGDRLDDSMRQIWVEESYIPIDYDGDGIAELRKIVSAGSGTVIFSNEPIDEVPIIAICPIPMPHKHVGMAVADLVVDLQMIKSTLLRQSLDNLYLSNSPRMIIDEMAVTDETYDDLLTTRPGGIVRVANIQGIQPLTVPFVAQNTLPVIQYLDEAQEIRTGISRHNQGISPDDLNQTATGISMIQQAASQRVELIARIFAEQGIRVLGQRILGLVIRHQQAGRIIRLTGNWVQMDPREWRENMDISVSVGLGTGNRDQAAAHLMQILQVQQQIVGSQGGVTGPLVTAQNIYDVLHKLTTNAGFKEDLFTDPSKMPPGQSQSPANPATMKAQAESQAIQAKTQAQMQSDRDKAQNAMQLDNQRAQHEMAVDAMKAQHQIEILKIREQAKAQLDILNQQLKQNQGQPGVAF